MNKYWIAITGDMERIDSPKKTWWCLPARATKRDPIFLYFPRSVSYSKTDNGIFAEYRISALPRTSYDKNYQCTGFGIRHGSSFGYTELLLKRKFNVFLTAKEMKQDSIISTAGFVRKNFQGTTFEMTKEIYEKIIELIAEKEEKKSRINIRSKKNESMKKLK
jgi:hypothetical protein